MKILPAIVLVLLYTLPSAADPVAFRHTDSLWSTFNDSDQGGNSATLGLQVADEVEWVFRLNRGAPWPYAGLILDIRSFRLGGKYDVSDNDSLVMYIRSNSAGRLLLQLAVYDPQITTDDDPVSFRVLETPVTVTTQNHRTAVPFRRFRVAEWWRQRYSVPPEDNRLFLDSICMVEWVISDTARVSKSDTLVISGLEFVPEKKKGVFDWPLGTVVLFSAALISFLLIRKLKRHSACAQVSKTEDLQPKPIPTGPAEWDRVMRYMESSYMLPELNLKKAAEDMGFSESRLSRLIRENYQNGFRSLIHDLRTQEGRRLLENTGLNIAEIAYKLGYATPSHFNREFKERTGMNPTSFRKQKQSVTD
ncbi:MAG: helix-turn-helix domain-containing protein [Chitinispirillaceae bacterium]